MQFWISSETQMTRGTRWPGRVDAAPGARVCSSSRTAASLTLTAPVVAPGREGEKKIRTVHKVPVGLKAKTSARVLSSLLARLRRGSLELISCVPAVRCRGIRDTGRIGQRETCPNPAAGTRVGTRVSYSGDYCEAPAVWNPGRCVCVFLIPFWYGLDRHLRKLLN